VSSNYKKNSPSIIRAEAHTPRRRSYVNKKRVALFNKTGEVIRIFSSVEEASRIQGITTGAIHSSCRRTRKTSSRKPYWGYYSVT
jgi:hypothetical protein